MSRFLETRKPPLIIAIGGLILLTVMSIQAFKEPQFVIDIKNGDKTLECLFSDGWKDIPSDKFVGFDDVSGRWLFTNGYAHTCEVN